MARRTFIRVQLRKSSCYRVQSVKTVWIDFIKRFPRFSKVVKITFVYSFVSPRAFGSKFRQFRFPPFKQPHLIIFTRSGVLVYITFAHGLTDGRTERHFSKKFYFFLLIKNIHIYMSEPKVSEAIASYL